MKTRMERIYEETDIETSASRTARNKRYYNRIDDDENYTNIEATIETPKSNEIDITKIRDLILRREEEENNKNRLVKRDVEIEMPNMALLEDEEEKNYDIIDVLSKAKEERTSREDKYHKLDEEYLEYLKHPEKKIEKIPMEDDIKEIKNLLNTLTSSLELKKMKASELSLDMLNELKDTGTIDTDDPLIKNLINGASKIEEDKNKEEDIDNTFNTTSMNIKVKDYGDDEPKKKNPVLSILIGLLIISVIALGVFILYKVVA